MGGKARDWLGQGLFRVCERGQVQAVRSILKDGASINYKDTQGNTPLMAAAWEGHEEVVGLLIDRGAVLNGKNRFGFTALILAVHYQREPIVKRLVEAGADVNETYENNGALLKNPLVVAAHHGNIELCKLLIEYGADLSITDAKGKSVRDYLNQSSCSTL